MLSARVAEGRFRADLYHRLAVVVLELPPLRARREDILVLAQRFLQQYGEAHRLSPKRLSGAAETWLLDYPWPGNVRELSHSMERLTLLTSEAIVGPHTVERLCLPRIQPATHAEASPATGENTPLDEVVRIAQALRQTKGNVVQAARLLGWSRSALCYRMQRYGVERPSGGARTSTSPSSPPPAGEGQAFAPWPWRGGGRGEGVSASQDDGRATPPSRALQTPTPSWEQKLVAVLVIEVTWPAAFERDTPRYEPWTLTAQWEQCLLRKVQGFGGVVIQQGPSLLLVAFGIHDTLEQLPQRVVQAALALRHLVMEAPAAASRPELRLVVHSGQLLMDPQAGDPAARLLPIGETLAWPVRLLGHVAPGEILVSPEVGRLVEGWFALQALVALQHLPESRKIIEQAIDLRFDLRNSLFVLREFERVYDYLREAESIAEALGDQRRLGKVAGNMSHYFLEMGDYHRAIECGQRALAFATALGDFVRQVATNLHLGNVYRSLGDYRRAMDVLKWNVASLEGELIYERFGLVGLPSVTSRAFLVWCLAELGEFVEGRVRGEEGLQIAEIVDQPFTLSLAYFGVGILYLRKGDLQKAIPALERDFELCQRWHILVICPWAASSLGYAYALSGRVAEALPLLEQTVRWTASTPYILAFPLWIAHLSEAYLLASRPDDAVPLAQRALDLCREHKERGHEAWALRLLGEIAAHREPPEVEPTEAAYQQALALADELGMRPLLAHCHLGLGTLYCRAGRLEQAGTELSAAIEVFRAMEMTFWLPRAEAELAQTE
jgi:tetratricopeptide (TPR) repeat protein